MDLNLKLNGREGMECPVCGKKVPFSKRSKGNFFCAADHRKHCNQILRQSPIKYGQHDRIIRSARSLEQAIMDDIKKKGRDQEKFNKYEKLGPYAEQVLDEDEKKSQRFQEWKKIFDKHKHDPQPDAFSAMNSVHEEEEWKKEFERYKPQSDASRFQKWLEEVEKNIQRYQEWKKEYDISSSKRKKLNQKLPRNVARR